MPKNEEFISTRPCVKVEPPHPCDPPAKCDPNNEGEGACPDPYVCLERLKNPESPASATRCREGKFMNVKSCAKVDPPHPCDPPVPCAQRPKKKPCSESILCSERVKNPTNLKVFEEPCTDIPSSSDSVDDEA